MSQQKNQGGVSSGAEEELLLAATEPKSCARKLDITIINPDGADDGEGISLAELWRAFKRHSVALLAWILIAMVACGALGCVMGLLSRATVVATIVSFSYEEAADGLDPLGDPMDINKIKSPQIVEAALAETVSLGGAQVDTEEVRQAVFISGLVPQDAIDQMTVVTTIASNANLASYLSNILEIEYHSTQYIVSLDYRELKISVEDARALLDAIVKSYRTYFIDTYGRNEMLGTALNRIDYANYDYSESVDIISTQLKTMTEYVASLSEMEETGTFRSIKTGFSFKDILSSLDILESVDLSLADALVYNYNLTRDKSMLRTYLNYQIQEQTRQLNVAKTTLQSVNAKLNQYEKNAIVMFGNGSSSALANQSLTLSVTSKEYDALIEQSIQATGEVSEIESDIAKLRKRVERIDDSSDDQQFEARCKQADERLASVSEKLNAWIDVITETAQEYFDTDTFNNSCKVLLPAQDMSEGKLVSMLKTGVIGAAVSAFGVLMVYAVAVLCSTLTKDRKKVRPTAE